MSELVPEGWASKTSGQLFDFLNGKAFYSDGYSDDGYRVIDLLNIDLSGKFQLTIKDKFISQDIYDKYPKAHLCKEDLIIIMTDITPSLGLIGKTAVIDRSDKYVLNQRVGCLRPKDLNLSVSFMNYMFNSDVVRLQVVANTLGTAQYYVNTPTLKNLDIPLPPFPEQQKIATILTSVDKVIEKTEAQINKLQDLKKGMMQELLTKGVGTNGVPHTEFKDSPVGRIPKGWDVVSLEQICQPNAPITYGVLKPGGYVVGGKPLLQIKDLKAGTISPHGLHLISDELDYEYRRSRVIAGDIVISLVGTIGRIAMIPDWLDSPNIHRNLGRIRTVHNKYVFQFLRSEYALSQLGLTSAGSSQSALNLSALRQMLLPLPPIEEASRISGILESLDKKLDFSQSKLDHLKDLKKALMQDLLTGKVRVKINESEKEAVMG
ncbi:type I restriction enzyme, S subunit [Alteromonadaceae bacterium Bs31]|nr:type I restriction enzyme, S subunit [Alteromonadaceae bacterium Bs31]